jgi:hypothetical protein
MSEHDVVRCFLVADRLLRVVARGEMPCGADDLENALVDLSEAFVVVRDGGPADIEVDIRYVNEREAPPAGEELPRGVTRLRDGVVLDTGAAWVAIRHGTPVRIHASVPGGPSPIFARWLLVVAIFVAARGLGLFHLHAALLETTTGGWLLVGPSGAGKSTTSLLLAAAGLVPRADDVVLLDERDGRVFPVARPFHLSPSLVSAFPAWTGGARPGARGKLDVRVARLDPSSVAVSAVFLLLGPGE